VHSPVVASRVQLVTGHSCALGDRTIEEDKALIGDSTTPVRQKVACRMLVCEKEILHDALDALMELPFAPTESQLLSPLDVTNKHVKLE
jgi:hypothetical protein